jgi:phenylacetic acid degradation operon negative regulatory protein
MKAKSELMLYHLFWLADFVLRPATSRIGESFGEWAYKKGFSRQIRELERLGYLESTPEWRGAGRVVKLTEKGRLRALGGADPELRWKRPWDGNWRMAVFDLPEEKRSVRNMLRKELRAAGFGCLQGSVWLSPDPVENVLGDFMKKRGEESRTILFFSGRPCDGALDEDLVRAAWNFEAIREAHREYMEHLKDIPRGGKELRERLLEWGKQERDLWSRCMNLDPLLPRKLWPRGYIGEKAWQARLLTLRSAGALASRD